MKSRFTALFASLLIAGCGKNQVESTPPPATPVDLAHAVVIVQKPLYVQRGLFVESANTHSQKGLTEWYFHCYPEFAYDVSKDPFAPNKIIITIKKVALTISCPVTIRVGVDANKPTLDHENGHVQLVKQIYDNANKVATEACTQVIGKQFTATGADQAEATANAVDLASRDVGKRYTKDTALLANELSKIYDEVTQHGYAKVSVSEAIKLTNQKFQESRAVKKQL